MFTKYPYIAFLMIAALMINCTASDKSSVKTEKEENKIHRDSVAIKVSKEQFESEEMKLTKLVKTSFPVVITSTGMIDVPPNNKAVISAHIGGYIKNAPLLVGDQVKKGQLLLTLENIEFLELQQDFLEASEQLQYLKVEYQRQQELYNEKIASEKVYLKAKSEYMKTSAIYKGLREKLKLLNINTQAVEEGQLSSVATIYSPITGDITEVEINTGAYVDPADHIMKIVNTDHIHLELTVFEKDALIIEKGQQVYFRLPESTSKSFKGEIHLIGRSIDENRRIKIHAHIEDEAAYRFIPGMFVQADIVVDQSVSFALPEMAIVENENRYYALKLIDSSNDTYSFEKVELKIGKTYNGVVQIINWEIIDKEADYVINGSNLLAEEGGGGHDH